MRRLVSVAERLRKARAPAGHADLRLTRNPGVEVFLWSRALIWLGLLFAYLWFEPKPPPLAAEFDSEHLHDVGWAIDVWARWDSGWFLRIAEHGYASDPSSTPAFFPLYPSLVAALGRLPWLALGVLVVVSAAVLWVVARRRQRDAGSERPA